MAITKTLEQQLAPSGQCVATSKNTGERCRARAIRGSTVCRAHGGATAHVKRKARLRIAELVDPAIATLARVMASPTAKDSDKLRAAENVLDRAGFGRTVTVEDPEEAKALLVSKLIELRRAAGMTQPETVRGELVQ